MLEVNQETWNVNGNGFSFPLGEGMVILSDTGIYYYICPSHISGGMKGIITVHNEGYVAASIDNSSIYNNLKSIRILNIPNNRLTIFNESETIKTLVTIYDLNGKLLFNNNLKIQSGYNQINIERSSTLCIVKIQQGSEIATKKIVVY